MKYLYRKSKWWSIVHYNYFHKRLFKEFYVKYKTFTIEETKKYELFIKLDNLITLRKWKWLRIFIFKLEG